MDVIPGRITEEDVLKLGEYFFSKLSVCCTKLVLVGIKRYLAMPNKDPKCAEIVENVFMNQLLLSDVIKDEKLMKAIKQVENLRYDSVSMDEPLNLLKEYQYSLRLVKSCEYSQPYRSAISSSYIKSVVELYKEAGFKDIAKKIDSAKGVFSEPVRARAVGTPFKVINYAEERLSVIRPGLNFLIDVKERGISPNAWRHL